MSYRHVNEGAPASEHSGDCAVKRNTRTPQKELYLVVIAFPRVGVRLYHC